MDIAPIAALFPELCDLATRAGRAAMVFYESGNEVRRKADNSEVGEADLAADAVIIAGLKRLTPDIAIVTEETFKDDTALPQAAFWVVDPIDGTKEFIAHSGEFTVNIGLVVVGRAVLGVIYVPATGALFWGGEGFGAWTKIDARDVPIHVRTLPEEGLTVVTSRYHGNKDKLIEFLAGQKVASSYPLGSTLKFCAIASGAADIYPHFGSGTREWDTAAGQAIVEAAGGSVQLLSGGDLTYGKPSLRNPPYVVKGA